MDAETPPIVRMAIAAGTMSLSTLGYDIRVVDDLSRELNRLGIPPASSAAS